MSIKAEKRVATEEDLRQAGIKVYHPVGETRAISLLA